MNIWAGKRWNQQSIGS